MNFVPPSYRRKRKLETAVKQKEMRALSKKALLFQKPLSFEYEEVEFRRIEEEGGDGTLIQLKCDADSTIHNVKLLLSIYQQITKHLAGRSPLAFVVTAHRQNADRILEWIFQFFRDGISNQHTFLSIGCTYSLCRLAIQFITSTLVPKGTFDEQEKRMLSQCYENGGNWSLADWTNELHCLEQFACHTLFDQRTPSKFDQPRSIHRDPRIEMLEKVCAWQFWVFSQMKMIQDREVCQLEVKQQWKDNLHKLYKHEMEYQLPANFYHQFLATVHSFILPVAARQRYMQMKKVMLKRVEVSTVWENMIDEETGQPIHYVLDASKMNEIYADLNHRFRFLFLLQYFDTYMREHFRFSWMDEFVVLPLDYPERYVWAYRRERQMRARSPLVFHLLDKWYVCQGVDRIYHCASAEELILTWLYLVKQDGGMTDRRIPLEELLGTVFR